MWKLWRWERRFWRGWIWRFARARRTRWWVRMVWGRVCWWKCWLDIWCMKLWVVVWCLRVKCCLRWNLRNVREAGCFCRFSRLSKFRGCRISIFWEWCVMNEERCVGRRNWIFWSFMDILCLSWRCWIWIWVFWRVTLTKGFSVAKRSETKFCSWLWWRVRWVFWMRLILVWMLMCWEMWLRWWICWDKVIRVCFLLRIISVFWTLFILISCILCKRGKLCKLGELRLWCSLRRVVLCCLCSSYNINDLFNDNIWYYKLFERL